MARPGDIIDDKYVVEERIGSGSMGVVVAARHRLLGTRVAIKILRARGVSRPDIIARFTREARSIASLDSEYVVRVLDFGVLDSGAPYIVMQHLTGSNLATVVQERGPLPTHEVVDYAIQSCAGLAAAHSSGIIHRDVKPGNLFLMRRASGDSSIKLLDFGIAKAPAPDGEEQASITSTAGLLGSPLYMSPEQIRHAKTVDARTDIWSLGVTMYHLITQQNPFQVAGVATFLASVVHDAPRPIRHLVPEVPEGLGAVIGRCLEKDRGRRYGSAAELAHALGPFGTARGRHVLDELEVSDNHDTSVEITRVNTSPPPRSVVPSTLIDTVIPVFAPDEIPIFFDDDE